MASGSTEVGPSTEPRQNEIQAVSPDIQNQSETGSRENNEYHGIRIVMLRVCLFLGNFLVGYDSSCIGTLTPVITDQFHALNDLGWYQIAYLVALCATMLMYGQLYTFYSMKTLYTLALGIFTVGSILTATAPSSVPFIIGRALSGLGAAGINSGISIIIANTHSLESRPVIFGICGAVECAALAFGPLISGTIANYTSWRVCFYIIIPMGVIITVVILGSIGHVRQPGKTQLSKMQRLKRVDWAGLSTEQPMIVCLVLALQWARTVYSWSDWRIILLFTLAGVLLFAFLFAEHRAGENSLVSLKVLRQRTVAFASLISFCNFAALWIMSFYLPLYFQAVHGASTLSSGLMYLPVALTMSISALAGGPLTSYIGYYSPTLAVGNVFSAVGTGLISTLQPGSSAAKWISYQIIYGIGIGLAFQPPFLAVQTVLEHALVPSALVLLSFVQMLGGIIVLSVAQNVFLSKLVSYLATAAPNLDTSAALNNGALSLIKSAPASEKPQVVASYNKALTDIFYIAVGLTCLSAVCTFGVQWKRMKQNDQTGDTTNEEVKSQ